MILDAGQSRPLSRLVTLTTCSGNTYCYNSSVMFIASSIPKPTKEITLARDLRMKCKFELLIQYPTIVKLY